MSNRPTIGNLFLSFLRLGLTAFGGPAMIAYIKDLSVNKNQWLDEESFKHGVVLCQTLPGAMVVNTASYVGLRVRGLSWEPESRVFMYQVEGLNRHLGYWLLLWHSIKFILYWDENVFCAKQRQKGCDEMGEVDILKELK